MRPFFGFGPEGAFGFVLHFSRKHITLYLSAIAARIPQMSL